MLWPSAPSEAGWAADPVTFSATYGNFGLAEDLRETRRMLGFLIVDLYV